MTTGPRCFARQISFQVDEFDLKRNSSGRTWIYEHNQPPPPINVPATALPAMHSDKMYMPPPSFLLWWTPACGRTVFHYSQLPLARYRNVQPLKMYSLQCTHKNPPQVLRWETYIWDIVYNIAIRRQIVVLLHFCRHVKMLNTRGIVLIIFAQRKLL